LQSILKKITKELRLYLWGMRLPLILLLAATSFGLKAQLLYTYAQADPVALTLGQEYHPNVRTGFGALVKIGSAQNFSMMPSGYMRFREHIVYGAYLQRKFRGDVTIFGREKHPLDSGATLISILPPVKWVWDLGIRGGYVTTIDHNPKHGFSHGNAILAFAGVRRQLNPWFQLGTEFGAGVHQEAMIYAGTIQFRASIYTPYLNPANW
jgi:hypothetical protein